MVYDLIIIGAGPAGITASVYAARKRLNFIVLTKDIGGQAAWSGDVENYTGYQFVTGPELVAKFEEHLRQYKIDVRENEPAIDVHKQDGLISVKTTKDSYQARAVIIATGKLSRELGVPGEKEFKNKGITYCATCDGPLFSGKDVAVIGGGNSALDAVIQLSKIASRIYVVNIAPGLTGDPVMIEKIKSDKKVEVITGYVVTEAYGDKMLSGIKIAPAAGNSGAARDLKVQGGFVEIGLVPSSDFVKDVARNDRKEIIVDPDNRTSIPGIFAAGDVPNIREKQIIIAAGEGSTALLNGFTYIVRLPK